MKLTVFRPAWVGLVSRRPCCPQITASRRELHPVHDIFRRPSLPCRRTTSLAHRHNRRPFKAPHRDTSHHSPGMAARRLPHCHLHPLTLLPLHKAPRPFLFPPRRRRPRHLASHHRQHRHPDPSVTPASHRTALAMRYPSKPNGLVSSGAWCRPRSSRRLVYDMRRGRILSPC